MNYIRDRDGKIVQCSKNLAGIRRYVGTHLIKVLAIDRIGKLGEGKLSILFMDGSSFETNFDFDTIRHFVGNWRNAYGAPLLVNGVDAGLVSYHNEILNKSPK